jgi:hypothetical protein
MNVTPNCLVGYPCLHLAHVLRHRIQNLWNNKIEEVTRLVLSKIKERGSRDAALPDRVSFGPSCNLGYAY